MPDWKYVLVVVLKGNTAEGQPPSQDAEIIQVDMVAVDKTEKRIVSSLLLLPIEEFGHAPFTGPRAIPCLRQTAAESTAGRHVQRGKSRLSGKVIRLSDFALWFAVLFQYSIDEAEPWLQVKQRIEEWLKRKGLDANQENFVTVSDGCVSGSDGLPSSTPLFQSHRLRQAPESPMPRQQHRHSRLV